MADLHLTMLVFLLETDVVVDDDASPVLVVLLPSGIVFSGDFVIADVQLQQDPNFFKNFIDRQWRCGFGFLFGFVK